MRGLTAQERNPVRWLLEHGGERAVSYLPYGDDLLAVATCGCWRDEEGRHGYAFVFAQEGRLAGPEAGSIDGRATPTALPVIEWLEHLGT